MKIVQIQIRRRSALESPLTVRNLEVSLGIDENKLWANAIFWIKKSRLKNDANLFYIISFSFSKFAFYSRLFNGTRRLIINWLICFYWLNGCLIKSNYAIICLCLVLWQFVGQQANSKSQISNDTWLAYKNKIPVMNQFNSCWVFSPSCAFLSKLYNSWTFAPTHHKTNKIACAPSEDSDNPGYLIRVFVVHMK